MRLKFPKTRGMLRREAAAWLARLQSERDPDIEAKFRRWRDADPAHAAAFERVRRSYDQAGLLRHSPALADRFEEPREAPAGRPRYALAAAAALAVLVPAGLLLLDRSPLATGGTQVLMLATNVGEIRSFELKDGSKVTLDTATRVEVAIDRSARNANLTSGRARFEIAESARPFIIEAGTATVTTARGVVDVERAGLQSYVNVIAGNAEVRLSGHADIQRIGAGQAVIAGEAGLARSERARPASDWTRGMLQFDGASVAEAIAIANRYSSRRILIDEDLAGLRVSGAFRAGDTEGLAKALAAAFGLSLRRTPDGNLLLSRRGLGAIQE